MVGRKHWVGKCLGWSEKKQRKRMMTCMSDPLCGYNGTPQAGSRIKSGN
jgi:hypothetical protein